MKQGIYIIVFFAFVVVKSTAGGKAGNVILPVAKSNISVFDMELKVTGVKGLGEISWQGLLQLDVKRYEIEKSIDGENFTYMTAVAGNNLSNTIYTAEDRNLLVGINYYRLKIVDNNGNINFSKVASFNKKNNDWEIKIIPEIVTDEVYIWLPANTQVSTAIITDAMGRKVERVESINNFTNVAALPIGRLPIGMYNLNVFTNTGQTVNLKFSKK
jgi:hypothetical protein